MSTQIPRDRPGANQVDSPAAEEDDDRGASQEIQVPDGLTLGDLERAATVLNAWCNNAWSIEAGTDPDLEHEGDDGGVKAIIKIWDLLSAAVEARRALRLSSPVDD